MDWANEIYVRLYIRDTATWLKMRWQGQNLLMQILRKVDRSGRMDGITDPVDDLSLVTGIPEEFVRIGLEKLEKLAVLEINDGILVLPNYIEAQTASRSDKQRQRESRENRRNAAINLGSDPKEEPPPKPPRGPSEDFMNWYEGYPNKTSRQTAVNAWTKLNKKGLLPDAQVLIDALSQQIEDRAAKASHGGFVPEWKNPATWLNGHCWEDVVDTTSSGGSGGGGLGGSAEIKYTDFGNEPRR